MYGRTVGKTTYYYESYRAEDGKIRKRYLGAAEAAVQAAEESVARTCASIADLNHAQALKRASDPLKAHMDDFRSFVRGVLIAVNFKDGLYLHKRQWRRRRGKR